MAIQTFFTPGPSQLYFSVQDHVRAAFRNNIMSISHRSKEFENLYQHTEEQLRELLEIPIRNMPSYRNNNADTTKSSSSLDVDEDVMVKTYWENEFRRQSINDKITRNDDDDNEDKKMPSKPRATTKNSSSRNIIFGCFFVLSFKNPFEDIV